MKTNKSGKKTKGKVKDGIKNVRQQRLKGVKKGPGFENVVSTR